MQRRRQLRVSVPANTTAFFYRNNRIYYGGLVKDLNSAGMLICTGNSENELTDASPVVEIAIALPRNVLPGKDGSHTESRFLTIDKGQVVRSFHDPKTLWVCHGISFEDDHTNIRDERDALVREIKSGLENND